MKDNWKDMELEEVRRSTWREREKTAEHLLRCSIVGS